MTKVGFYVVAQAEEAERLRVAARLSDKAFGQGHKIYINTSSEQQAQQLDELLWNHRPQSFLPHGLLGASGSEHIAIGWGQEPAGHDDLLINLNLEIPAFFSRFKRVAEVVTQDEKSLSALRQSWRFYKERGYQLNKYDL